MPAIDSRGAPVAVPVPDEQHVVSMRDLLQGGVHFGHQTRRWNPKMKPYIFAERGGIYIIDLMKTTVLLDEACAFVRDTVSRGGSVLFVGTKKQCQESIKEQAQRVAMPYVSNRWLGGLLTNYATINRRIRVLHEMREQLADGTLDKMPAREAIRAKGELQKLENNLGGVSVMDRMPSAVFVVDPHKEQIVVREAHKLGLPLIGLVDTNCDPDEIDYVIPGNDDAIRSCALIVRVLADAVEEGRQLVSERDVRTQIDRSAAGEPAVAEARTSDARRRPADRGRGDRRGGGAGDRRGGGRGRAGGPGGPRPVNLGEPPIGRTPRTAASRDRQEAAAAAKEAAKAEAEAITVESVEAGAQAAPEAVKPEAAPPEAGKVETAPAESDADGTKPAARKAEEAKPAPKVEESETASAESEADGTKPAPQAEKEKAEAAETAPKAEKAKELATTEPEAAAQPARPRKKTAAPARKKAAEAADEPKPEE